MNQLQIKRIYLDNSLLVGWFLVYLREAKNPIDPEIIQFLSKNKEIEVFISHLSIAELMEHFLFHDNRIREHMRKPEMIFLFLEELRNVLNLKVITHIGKNGIEGNFVPKEMINFTILCKEPIDAIHAAIAKYEDLYFITHDSKLGILSKLYNKTITDKHFYKFFME